MFPTATLCEPALPRLHQLNLNDRQRARFATRCAEPSCRCHHASHRIAYGVLSTPACPPYCAAHKLLTDLSRLLKVSGGHKPRQLCKRLTLSPQAAHKAPCTMGMQPSDICRLARASTTELSSPKKCNTQQISLRSGLAPCGLCGTSCIPLQALGSDLVRTVARNHRLCAPCGCRSTSSDQ